MDKQRTSWQVETVPAQAEPKGWAYNRPLAIGLIAVAVVFALLFGVSKGVRGQYRAVTEAYAQGLDGSGYGIVYYQQNMAEHAANLCKIANKDRYQGAFQTQTAAVSEAITQAQAAKNAGELYDAVMQLIESVDVLNLAMQDQGLDAQDETLRVGEYQDFTDQFYKARNIAVDYNELARSYNDKVLGSFPASALKGLLGLPEAEEFS